MDSNTRDYLRKMATASAENEIVKTATLASIEKNNNRMQEYQPLPETRKEVKQHRSIIRNPDSYYPELSPDYEFMLSGKKYKYSR